MLVFKWRNVQHCCNKCFTSGVWVDPGLVVLCQVVGNSRDDDDPVIVVGEGLVVAAAEGRVTADCRRRRDAAASAGVDQGFHLGRIL